MHNGLFITGTDTDVGKTVVATGLLQLAADCGLSTAAIKPVAAGCVWSNGSLVNDDALHLQAAATLVQSYEAVNPVALEPAIAPHIAAAQAGLRLSVGPLLTHCETVIETAGADVVVVEGAGGWLVPLNDEETLGDLAKSLGLPVVIVVGLKLGCINHALLTERMVESYGLSVAGWVANTINPDMDVYDENVESLKQRLRAPCLGVVPYLSDVSPLIIARHLDEGVFR
jgi:dethiobiotin synthetase